MDYKEKWEVICELGGGGQGKVFKVIPNSIGYNSVDRQLIKAIRDIGTSTYADEYLKEIYPNFRDNIFKIFEKEKPENQRALKILHKPQDARDAELAEERIKREITAMSECKHPNLINVVDYDLESKWFVSEYYFKGSLSKNPEIFKGDVLKALKSFRPLVEGVAYLHDKNLVHRDIKPENVFIDKNDNLILGDFGLIFFIDEDKTRISQQYENVGSRDWMPGWALGMLIEDIKPTFDVFSLGKLLWAMISGKTKLQLWYFYKEQFNLENLFPNDENMKMVNNLFKKCIVEEESNCLPTANDFLTEIDNLIYKIEKNADIIDLKVKRRCKVCGVGEYKLRVDEDTTGTRNFGIDPVGERRWKIFTCTHCGHVQFFSYLLEKKPEVWRNSE